ncbi:MAG: glycosyltransferase family 4 protein [Bryobacteraceae bacterium]
MQAFDQLLRLPSVLGRERRTNLAVRLLAGVARARQHLGVRPRSVRRLKHVVHISPAYFSDDSYVGGGERWAMSLAEAMATKVETTLVSFGARRETIKVGALKLELYPVSSESAQVHSDVANLGFLQELRSADAVHCHHFRTAVSSLALAGTKIAGGRTFVTELGGSAPTFLAGVETTNFVDCFLHLSNYAATLFPMSSGRVVYGGVNKAFLNDVCLPIEMRRQVLCVARLLPHKGINYLIDAIAADQQLELIGKVYHPEYFQLLQERADGKQVRFTTDASDEDLVAAYRRSIVTVLPSVYEDVYGSRSKIPELLGLVLLESMACGTPVICTRVASMPELVEDGVTGFIVPPNDPGALRQAIQFMRTNPATAAEMGQRGRQRVLERFTWDRVADSCLEAYQQPIAA